MQCTLMHHDSRQNGPKIVVGMNLVQIFVFVDKFNSARSCGRHQWKAKIVMASFSPDVEHITMMPWLLTHVIQERWLTTVLMHHISPPSNSLDVFSFSVYRLLKSFTILCETWTIKHHHVPCSKRFFHSLFTVCLSLLSFYVKLEQWSVTKWRK